MLIKAQSWWDLCGAAVISFCADAKRTCNYSKRVAFVFQIYLKRFRLNNTDQNDLWDAMEEVGPICNVLCLVPALSPPSFESEYIMIIFYRVQNKQKENKKPGLNMQKKKKKSTHYLCTVYR